MQRTELNPLAAYAYVYDSRYRFLTSSLRPPLNPFDPAISDKRPLSASIEDLQFGDTGKGQATLLLVEQFLTDYPEDEVYVIRYNGSANAGHATIRDGVKITNHQMPVGVRSERTVNILGKGMLIHTTDLVTEIDYSKAKLDGELPGEIIIDGNTLVATDMHRAYEGFILGELGVGKGSTASGVAPGYADHYLKKAIRMRIFLENNWEEAFRAQYRFFAKLLGGNNVLANWGVKAMTVEGKRIDQKIGTEEEFIDRLRRDRERLKPYINNDVALLIDYIWRHTKKPVVFEGAQGDGLDTFFGPYPDVTASRTIARIGVPDATEGFITFEDIAFKAGAVKIPYMSIVGSKVPPYQELPEADVYRNEFSEFGETTGRPRGIYPEDFVIMTHLARVSQVSHVIFTHVDAVKSEFPIKAVLAYRDKKSGFLAPYRPYQWEWDKVEAVTMGLPPFDGKQIHAGTSIDNFPKEALLFTDFSNRILPSAIMFVIGPNQGDVIFNLP